MSRDTVAAQPARPPRTRIVMVAAVAQNGVIGNDGAIPWHLPEDFAHFKRVTTGHTLVMGRATFESIGRPLPGRTTVVLTRDPDWSADGVHVARDLESALELAAQLPGDVVIAGGAAVYAAAMDRADEQILTEVHLAPEGDTLYPDFDRSQWQETRRESHDGFDIVRWERD
ncbi:dihydrofolate reductase [Nocardioides sp.]|uniref:dihydrofolate reductase n=1 Tax=Nocardioides sp. TaxID=35761 RepID=UPI0027337A19|nr:dihydrofolate reductase [Nocardioides sp.]MDP3890078.1 dihydrofolate reductase [Nocardioides sp.]